MKSADGKNNEKLELDGGGVTTQGIFSPKNVTMANILSPKNQSIQGAN